MTRIRTALPAALVTLALALAGCSSGDSGSGNTGSGDAGDSGDSGDYTGQTLTIWHYEGETSAMGKAWLKAQEIFEAEHPGVTVTVVPQTFEQIQKNAKIILTGDDVPDVMEYNKGNATAGQLASQGLLTPLDDVVAARGWEAIVNGALATTGQYSEEGLMGSGNWYGITNYGEYVTVFYNADMFDEYGVAVPTTLAELEAAMDTFVAAGVTPLATAGAEYPLMQVWYQLALSQADRTLVNEYQLFDGDLDWHNAAFTYAADTLAEWVDKGYIASDVAGIVAEDMGVAFIAGKYPIMITGSWWFGRLKDEVTFNWGQFLFPGNTLNTGSSGNIWVVPESAKNKELAYDFIDATLRPEVQNIFGENGGLPISGDPATITDEATRVFTENFLTAVNEDQLAFYPDWPVAGFYDQLVSAFQSVVNGSKSTDEVLTALGDYYEAGKADLIGG